MTNAINQNIQRIKFQALTLKNKKMVGKIAQLEQINFQIKQPLKLAWRSDKNGNLSLGKAGEHNLYKKFELIGINILMKNS